eukprot:jgi/Mesvir1/7094/Mv09202-RA.1
MDADKVVGNAKSDLFQGVAKTQFGYKLLQQMGWEEGKGLGAAENGITEHIRVRKKTNGAGIGLDKATKERMDWTANTSVFDNILRSLSEVKTDSPRPDGNAVAAKQSSSSSSSSEEERAEEEVKPKKLARHQGRYHKHQKAKLTHSYSGEHLNEILGGLRPSEDADKSVTPDRGATASSRQDAAPAGTGEDSGGPGKKRMKGGSSAEEATARARDSAATTTGGRPPLSIGAAGASRIGIKASTPAPAAPAPNPSWWGAKFGFVKGPTIGSAPVDAGCDDKRADKEVASGSPAGAPPAGKKGKVLGFTESDQENLYTHAQEHAIKGKRGLGMDGEGRPLKKSKWAGSKVRFGDASSSGDEASQDESTDRGSPPPREEPGAVPPPPPTATKTEGKATKSEGKAKKSEGKGPGEKKAGGEDRSMSSPAPAEAGEKGGKEGGRKKKGGEGMGPSEAATQEEQGQEQDHLSRRIKWKKMISRALAQEPDQSMKMRRLQERVTSMVVEKHGDLFEASRACPQKTTEAAVKEQVSSSSRFVVKGKRVSLSSGTGTK